MSMYLRLLPVILVSCLMLGGCAVSQRQSVRLEDTSYARPYAMNGPMIDLFAVKSDRKAAYHSRNDRRPYATGSYYSPVREKVTEYSYQSSHTYGNRVYYRDHTVTRTRREYVRGQ